MNDNDFKDEEKIEFANKIISLYYNKNFGSTSKTDFETLIFSEYIEHLLRNNKDIDDYTVSKELGITQNRVRNLKERKELKYPREEFDWKQSFIKSFENAKYDENKHQIRVLIQDVNVMNEIRHYIEINGWYDEVSLNKKLLNLSLNCCVEVFGDFDNNKIFSKSNLKKIKNINTNGTLEEVKNLFDDFTKERFMEFLKSASIEAIVNALEILPFGGLAGDAIKKLIKIMRGM